MNTEGLAADYFDGHSAQPHLVQLRLAAGQLHIDGDDVSRVVPVKQVQWPERQRHGARVAHLRDGASLQAHDAQAWDAWWRAGGMREPLAVRLQQSWRATAGAAALLLLLAFAGYRWGLPAAARAVGQSP